VLSQKIDLSAERQIGRSRSAQMLCHMPHVLFMQSERGAKLDVPPLISTAESQFCGAKNTGHSWRRAREEIIVSSKYVSK